MPELAAEALAVPVLPRVSGRDVKGRGTELHQPLSQSPGDHLRFVAGAAQSLG